MSADLVLTVDVETDWGTPHTRGIDEALPRLLEVLDAADARATFFVVGDVADAVRTHLPPESRHEVGSHSQTHARLSRLSAAEVEAEVRQSRETLTRLGYEVRGFRAPFLRGPRALPRMLAEAGYAYDSSVGSVLPSLRNLRLRRAPRTESGIRRIQPSTLWDQVTPFSLTALRVLDPLATWLRPRGTAMLFCHLHEFVDSRDGWHALPRTLRWLHGRNTGARAWSLLDGLLGRARGRTRTCSEHLELCS